ncbi:hypothetical protein CVT24_002818, partial [Panaeolus cyanescens]
TFTRFVLISDTHARTFPIPPCDVLLHSGDFTNTGSLKDVERVVEWMEGLRGVGVKIIIAGNHDITLDEEYYEMNWTRYHQGIGKQVRLVLFFLLLPIPPTHPPPPPSLIHIHIHIHIRSLTLLPRTPPKSAPSSPPPAPKQQELYTSKTNPTPFESPVDHTHPMFQASKVAENGRYTEVHGRQSFVRGGLGIPGMERAHTRSSIFDP